MFTVRKEVQPEKALSYTWLRYSGKSTDLKLVQPLKAYLPMEVKLNAEFFSLIEFRPVQPRNAPSVIFSSLLGS